MKLYIETCVHRQLKERTCILRIYPHTYILCKHIHCIYMYLQWLRKVKTGIFMQFEIIYIHVYTRVELCSVTYTSLDNCIRYSAVQKMYSVVKICIP